MLKKTLALIIIILANAIIAGEWSVYTNYHTLFDILVRDNYVWVASSGGIIKYELNTKSQLLYTIPDGLPCNRTYEVVLDSTGNFWFVFAQSGLARFDGTNWTLFNESNGLPNDNIDQIIVDKKNNIWVSTDDWYKSYPAVFKYNGGNWDIYDTTRIDYYIEAFCLDNNGNTIGAGFYGESFDSSAYKVVEFKEDTVTEIASWNCAPRFKGDNTISGLACDDKENYWLATNTRIGQYNGSSWTYYDSTNGLPTGSISGIMFDKQQCLWVGTYYKGTIIKKQPTGWVVYDTTSGLPYSYNIKPIFNDALGNLWVNGYGYFGNFNGAAWSIYSTTCDAPYFGLGDIVIDNNDKLWITAYDICSLKDDIWKVYYGNDGPGIRGFEHIILDKNNNVWAGGRYGLVKYNGSTWDVYDSTDGLKYKKGITDLVIDSTDRIWAGTDLGIAVYNGLKWLMRDSLNKREIKHCSALSADPDGSMWCAITTFDSTETYKNRLCNIGTNYMTYIDSTDKEETDFDIIECDKNGKLWCGNMYGVYTYDGQEWSFYATNKGNTYYYTNAITFDKKGGIWVGTSKGLYYSDGVGWSEINIGYSSLCNSIRDIAIDTYNTKWISTADGLFRYTGEGNGITPPDKITEDKPQLKFTTYPNPFKNRVTIHIPHFKKNSVLNIYDSRGTLVRCIYINNVAGSTIYWDGLNQYRAEMQEGVYYFEFISGDQKKYSSCMLIK